MTEDTTDKLAEKERAITEAENVLDHLEASCDAVEKELALYRIQKDEITVKQRQREQDLLTLKPDIRKTRHMIARLKREHSQLMRDYFRERDQMKGQR